MKTRLASFAVTAALAVTSATATASAAGTAVPPDDLDTIRTTALDVLRDAGELRDAIEEPQSADVYETDRIAGRNRFVTSAMISRATYDEELGLPFGQVVFVTTGQNFPDALASGPAAASLFGSVLLVPSRGTVPAEVLDEIRRLHGMSPPAGVSVIVLGSEDAVSQEVAGQVFGAAPGAPTRTRLAGKNRYDTARQLAELVVAWDESGEQPVPVDPDTVYLASGSTYADALAGGAAAAWEYAPLLLTQPSALPSETTAALTEGAYSRVKILGSSSTVSLAVEAQVRTLLPDAEIVRYAGKDRFETAALMNADAFDELDAEIHLANGLNYPDALAVAPRVNLTWGPTVLTRPGCLPAPSGGTVEALQPWLVTALGTPETVSAAALEGAVCP